MKQHQYAPYSVAQMALTLFAAIKGYLDDVDVAKIVSFESAMQAYVKTNNAALVDTINETGDYNDDIEAQLHQAIKDFKSNGSW